MGVMRVLGDCAVHLRGGWRREEEEEAEAVFWKSEPSSFLLPSYCTKSLYLVP